MDRSRCHRSPVAGPENLATASLRAERRKRISWNPTTGGRVTTAGQFLSGRWRSWCRAPTSRRRRSRRRGHREPSRSTACWTRRTGPERPPSRPSPSFSRSPARRPPSARSFGSSTTSEWSISGSRAATRIPTLSPGRSPSATARSGRTTPWRSSSTRSTTTTTPTCSWSTRWGLSRTNAGRTTGARGTSPGTPTGCRRARRARRGWTAEVAIPFETVRFARETTAWGFNAIRYLPRNLEQSHWVPGLSEWFRIDEIGAVTDLDLTEAVTKSYAFIPYVQGVLQETQDAATEFGLDLRYAPSSNIGIDFSFNPDFATVEADVEQVNLTRYELSYPEKRPFFLEGTESYSGPASSSSTPAGSGTCAGARRSTGRSAGGGSTGWPARRIPRP